MDLLLRHDLTWMVALYRNVHHLSGQARMRAGMDTRMHRSSRRRILLMLKSSGAEIPGLLFRQNRPLRRLYVYVFDVFKQLRNRVERGLAFLHTTAHQPTTLEVDTFIEFNECLIDMT